jgi:hypothetical protein
MYKKLDETTIDGILFLLSEEEEEGLFIECPEYESKTPCGFHPEYGFILLDGFYSELDGMSEIISDVLYAFGSKLNPELYV